jgi:hypothetical protein
MLKTGGEYARYGGVGTGDGGEPSVVVVVLPVVVEDGWGDRVVLQFTGKGFQWTGQIGDLYERKPRRSSVVPVPRARAPLYVVLVVVFSPDSSESESQCR